MSQQIKGAVLKSRLGFVEDTAGKEGVARVLARMPADHQRTLRMLFTSNWYPWAWVMRSTPRSWTSSAMVVRRCSSISARHRPIATWAGCTRATWRRANRTCSCEKAPQIYAMYYETGRRTYERTGDRSGVLTTYDAPDVNANDCRTVVGWYRRALELCGVTGVKVRETECRARGGAVCRYEVSWA